MIQNILIPTIVKVYIAAGVVLATIKKAYKAIKNFHISIPVEVKAAH